MKFLNTKMILSLDGEDREVKEEIDHKVEVEGGHLVEEEASEEALEEA
jgi:hypothetical protein